MIIRIAVVTAMCAVLSLAVAPPASADPGPPPPQPATADAPPPPPDGAVVGGAIVGGHSGRLAFDGDRSAGRTGFPGGVAPRPNRQSETLDRCVVRCLRQHAKGRAVGRVRGGAPRASRAASAIHGTPSRRPTSRPDLNRIVDGLSVSTQADVTDTDRLV